MVNQKSNNGVGFGIVVGFIAMIGVVIRVGLHRTVFKKKVRNREAVMQSKEVVAVAKDKPIIHFKKVKPVGKIDIRKIRNKLGLSQEEFADYFGFNMRTMQEWEQGRREPSAPIRNLLKVIEKNPKAIQDALLADEGLS